MRSSITSIIIGLVIIAAVGFGGYLIIKKFRASADTESSGTTLSADLNKDGKVDALDLSVLTTAMSEKSTDKKYDLNKDGEVNSLDLNILINQYKK
ncbi:MAG: dockerin type I domain-containing protein [Candidatus Berkelbacteria bacterium]|nr:dockerin type I domain-containing protein [Candidatus Berkelbacteria bacterium]